MTNRLHVARRYIPFDDADKNGWALYEFQRVIWSWERGKLHVECDEAPENYAPGLLYCYADGVKVGLDIFDNELKAIGLSRQAILKSTTQVKAPESVARPSSADPATTDTPESTHE